MFISVSELQQKWYKVVPLLDCSRRFLYERCLPTRKNIDTLRIIYHRIFRRLWKMPIIITEIYARNNQRNKTGHGCNRGKFIALTYPNVRMIIEKILGWFAWTNLVKFMHKPLSLQVFFLAFMHIQTLTLRCICEKLRLIRRYYDKNKRPAFFYLI